MDLKIQSEQTVSQLSRMNKPSSKTRLSISTAADAIIAIHRMDSMTNFADDQWYLNFFCSEISASQLSMFHIIFLQKLNKESQMVDKEAFQECVIPILTEEQKKGFGGKRFQVLFDKIDANRDCLISWDDISLFVLQGSGTHKRPLTAGGSSSFFANNFIDKTNKSHQMTRRQCHKDVISSMLSISQLDVLVTAGHDGQIGVWKIKDLEMLQMIQVCPSNSTWISGMTEIAWSADANGHATMLCLLTSSMRLYYAKVDEISSAFSTADPDSACPCVYSFPSDQNATCIRGFRLFHAEVDASIPSVTGQGKFDDMLAIGFENGDIRIMLARVDRMRPAPHFKIRNHTSTISALIWIAEMSTIVAASHDSKISMNTFNLSRDGISETKVFGAHSKAVDAILFSSRDAIVASCGLERDILVWSPFTTQLLARLTGHNSSVFSLVVDPLSSSLISLGSDRLVLVWSLSQFQCICKQNLASKLHADVDIKCMIVEGSTLFYGTNAPFAWPMTKSSSVDTSKVARTISHSSPLIALLQSDHFEQFITVDADGQVATWAMATGSQIMNFWVCPTLTVIVNCAILDPVQRRLVVGSDDGIIRMYNVFNGQILHELSRSSTLKSSNLNVEKAEVRSMCFVNRQMRIFLAATFSDTSSITIWPEYPPNYAMSSVFNLDIRGNFGLSTPEQIGYTLNDSASTASNCALMLMANGRLATISIDSGHTIAEFSVAKTATGPNGAKLASHHKRDVHTVFTLDQSKSDQTLIRMFVLAHSKHFLIAVESENHFHSWDFSKNVIKKSFEVLSRDSSNSCCIMCMDLSSDDGLLCVGDSHGWIHTYVNPFSVQSNSNAPSWSFYAHADSINILKFVGNLDIIATSGLDLFTKLWRPDGMHFLHDDAKSGSSSHNISATSTKSSLSSSALVSTSSHFLGAFACTPWKYEYLLMAQAKFTRVPKPTMHAAVQLLRKLKREVETLSVSSVSQEVEQKTKPQLFLKSLKLLSPATPQEEREQSRMLLALATPRRGHTTIANTFPHMQPLRGPHSKIVMHPIAPDPYLSPKKGYTSIMNHLTKRDPTRAFLPKDSFKESIIRQDEHASLRSTEASPLLKRSLKLVSLNTTF